MFKALASAATACDDTTSTHKPDQSVPGNLSAQYKLTASAIRVRAQDPPRVSSSCRQRARCGLIWFDRFKCLQKSACQSGKLQLTVPGCLGQQCATYLLAN